MAFTQTRIDIMATKTELATAQEAFYSALKKSAATVASLRLSRTGKRGGTAEIEAVQPNTETMGGGTLVGVRRKRRPSMMRVSTPEMSESEFQATMMLIRRLQHLENEENAEILCIDHGGARFRNGHAKFTCKGLSSFWTRAGKTPPTVIHTKEPLYKVIARDPIAVFMDPDETPDIVTGYIKVILEEPFVCMLIRQD